MHCSGCGCAAATAETVSDTIHDRELLRKHLQARQVTDSGAVGGRSGAINTDGRRGNVGQPESERTSGFLDPYHKAV